jgi:hypothetical protein
MSRTSRAVPARESTPQSENPSATSNNNTPAGLQRTSLSIGMAIPSLGYMLIRECGQHTARNACLNRVSNFAG